MAEKTNEAINWPNEIKKLAYPAIVTGVVVYIIKSIFPGIPIDIVQVFGFIVLLAVVYFISSKIYQNRRFRNGFLLSSSIIIVVVFVGIVLNQRAQVINFFLIDSSSNMQGNYDQILRAKFPAQDTPEKDEIALATYGNGLSGNIDECKDLKVLLSPVKNSDKTLESFFFNIDNLKSIGASQTNRGDLQYAILNSLEHITDKSKTLRFLIITSSVDERCENLDRKEINQEAKKLGISKIIITIIGVGTISENDDTIYKSFADIYEKAENNQDLQNFLESQIKKPIRPYWPYSP